jgi:hypothetical protein
MQPDMLPILHQRAAFLRGGAAGERAILWRPPSTRRTERISAIPSEDSKCKCRLVEL